MSKHGVVGIVASWQPTSISPKSGKGGGDDTGYRRVENGTHMTFTLDAVKMDGFLELGYLKSNAEAVKSFDQRAFGKLSGSFQDESS